MTRKEPFFETYKLLELSVKRPVCDVIFASKQPISITEILAREYEQEHLP